MLQSAADSNLKYIKPNSGGDMGFYGNSIKDCDFTLSDFVGGDKKVGFNYSRSFVEML
jgi:hypothetical protein